MSKATIHIRDYADNEEIRMVGRVVRSVFTTGPGSTKRIAWHEVTYRGQTMRVNLRNGKWVGYIRWDASVDPVQCGRWVTVQ